MSWQLQTSLKQTIPLQNKKNTENHQTAKPQSIIHISFSSFFAAGHRFLVGHLQQGCFEGLPNAASGGVKGAAGDLPQRREGDFPRFEGGKDNPSKRDRKVVWSLGLRAIGFGLGWSSWFGWFWFWLVFGCWKGKGSNDDRWPKWKESKWILKLGKGSKKKPCVFGLRCFWGQKMMLN